MSEVKLSAEILALMETLPPRLPRDRAAELVTRHFFALSHRTMERWPIKWRRLNGKAHCETIDLFTEAQRVLDGAEADYTTHAKTNPLNNLRSDVVKFKSNQGR